MTLIMPEFVNIELFSVFAMQTDHFTANDTFIKSLVVELDIVFLVCEFSEPADSLFAKIEIWAVFSAPILKTKKGAPSCYADEGAPGR